MMQQPKETTTASLRKSRAPIGDWRKYGNEKSYHPLPQQSQYINAHGNESAVSVGTVNSNVGSSYRKNSNGMVPAANGNGSNNNYLLPKASKFDQEKIKRRISMRADMPLTMPGNMPALPIGAMDMIMNNQPVPDMYVHNNSSALTIGSHTSQHLQIPGQQQQQQQQQQFLQQKASSSSFSGNRPRNASFSEPLADPNLDARAYVTSRLSNANAAEVDDFTTKLASLDDRIDEDIKNNVNKSYEKILIVSNDLTATSEELKGLKSAVNKLQEIADLMKSAAESRIALEDNKDLAGGKGSSGRRKGRDRSSVIMLEKKWVNELNMLFKHVEGASKFLTSIPNRHVLAESGKWNELNVATWKSLKNLTHLFILNDHVLIASVKIKNNNTRLVAEQCWTIRDLKMIEIPDTEEGHIVNFKFQGYSYMYRTNSKDQYLKITQAFHKAKSQMKDILEQESLRQRQLRDSMSMLGDRTSRHELNGFNDGTVGGIILASNMMSSQDSTDMMRRVTEIDELIDEIDVNSSYKKYQDAFELIEECISRINDEIRNNSFNSNNNSNNNNNNNNAQVFCDVLNERIEEKKDNLQNLLVAEINDELNTFDDIKEYIHLLKKLNRDSIAKDSLLSSRTKLIHKLIRDVEFEGDLPDYITQISIIRFQIIKSTSILYLQAFHDPEFSSDIIKWSTEQIKEHSSLLEKQLFDVKYGSPVYRACLDITKSQAQDLKSVGLDVDFLLKSVYEK